MNNLHSFHTERSSLIALAALGPSPLSDGHARLERGQAPEVFNLVARRG